MIANGHRKASPYGTVSGSSLGMITAPFCALLPPDIKQESSWSTYTDPMTSDCWIGNPQRAVPWLPYWWAWSPGSCRISHSSSLTQMKSQSWGKSSFFGQYSGCTWGSSCKGSSKTPELGCCRKVERWELQPCHRHLSWWWSHRIIMSGPACKTIDNHVPDR